MFNVKSRKLVTTLFCSLALLLVLTDGASANPHLDGHRMLRKRSPQFVELTGRQNIGDIIDPGTVSEGDDPNGGGGGGGGNPANSVSSSSSGPPSVSTSSVLPLVPSIGVSLTASNPSVTPSLSTSSSVSSSPSSSSTPPPDSSPTPPGQSEIPVDSSTNNPSKGQSTETRTVISSASSSTGTSPPATGATSTTKTTLTVIIALAASIGGIAIIWTVIRKWKFKPSNKFEDRMQPIDWQPTAPEEGIPGLHRNTSTRSDPSFHSGGHESDHSSLQHHGGSIRRGPSPLPEHDFTPGPSHLTPGGGYADLARGPSPQPQMSQMHEAQFGVPLHHQGAYDSYGDANGQKY